MAMYKGDPGYLDSCCISVNEEYLVIPQLRIRYRAYTACQKEL